MQRWCEGKEILGKVRGARRGPRGSLASVHRSPQRSGARQPSLQASTGCLQGILQETQEFYRKSANFYRMCCSWSLGDGGVEEWYEWMGKVKEEFVMAQGQRSEVRKE